MKKDLRMLGELRKGPLAGMDEDEFKMIEEDVKKFGFKGLSGYAKSTVMRAMRLMGSEINKAVAQRKAELEKHGDHDQADHGAWSSGGGGAESDKYEAKGTSKESQGSYKDVDTKTTPAVLDKLFGRGRDARQDDEFEPKVTESWTGEFKNNATGETFVAEVYDWMRYDQKGLSVRQGFKQSLLPRNESYDFHIGAQTKEQAQIVRDVIEGASKKTNKELLQKAKSVSVGDRVSWNASGGTAEGKVLRIERSGKINVPDSSFEIEGTEDDPAALIVLYRDGKPTDRKVGHKVSTLKKK
jgi:hypothetical protein